MHGACNSVHNHVSMYVLACIQKDIMKERWRDAYSTCIFRLGEQGTGEESEGERVRGAGSYEGPV